MESSQVVLLDVKDDETGSALQERRWMPICCDDGRKKMVGD